MPKRALVWFRVGLRLVVEDEPSELFYKLLCVLGSENVLIKEVSLFQGCPYGGAPL